MSNDELREKLIQLYEKGADSVLIDWKRDDVKPLIDEIIVDREQMLIQTFAQGYEEGYEDVQPINNKE